MFTRTEKILLSKLEEEIVTRTDHLAQGGAKEYSEYRESVGYLDGLKAVIRLMEEIEREENT